MTAWWRPTLALLQDDVVVMQTPDPGRRGLQWVVRPGGDVAQGSHFARPDAMVRWIEHRDGASGGFGGSLWSSGC